MLKVTLGELLPYRANYRKIQGTVSPTELLIEAVRADSGVFYNLHVKATQAQKIELNHVEEQKLLAWEFNFFMIIEWIIVVKSEGADYLLNGHGVL
ncbi:hypothetical protein [Yersinia pekkanenii]|uniref:Uncharacterized protein n=1 Tax=Yersinia pekkanenii TaxID=1288385 RepID=A0A0T9NKN0_9GAMM|nr:hypothetical protein [Yersinia pekkanenii]CNH17294.1 Uncharacterised protein [Yersinia pekkanenii]CRY65708.1 Uncharacterised protein [Yersinia pekkanenii]